MAVSFLEQISSDKIRNFCDRYYCLWRFTNLKKVAEISSYILVLMDVTGTGMTASNIGQKKDAL